MQPSEEIKSKLDIVDLISEYIPVKAAGSNFRALCPFHREKSPSFMISPEKQIWHCFGCQKGGDIFTFIMELEGLSFVEALRTLAPKAGVTLKRQDPQITSQRNRSLDILEASANYYQEKINIDQSQASGEIKEALDYLNQRGIDNQVISDWRIGYSMDSWDDLIIFLKSKGYNEKEIFAAGMSIQKENTNRSYNRFRGRIMFPIADINGNIIAFSARVLPSKEDSEVMGKYINSPQTQIYDKSRVLFGLDKAKLEIKSQDLAIVVEGQMDVITAHKHGFQNVIASSGTALTHDQLILIRRYTNNIAFAFDMDQAGQLAADRGIAEALGLNMNIKIISIPQGKDPDDCIKENPEDWQKAVIEAAPMMEYYFTKIFKNFDLNNFTDRKEGRVKILKIINRIGDEIEKDFWIKKLSEKINAREDLLREELKQIKIKEEKRVRSNSLAQNIANQEEIKKETQKQSREEKLSETLLVLILKFPDLCEYVFNNVSTDLIANNKLQFIYNKLMFYYNDNKGEKINYDEFRRFIKDSLEKTKQVLFDNFFNRLILLGDKDFGEYTSIGAKNEIIKIILELKKKYLENAKLKIEKLISIAEKENKNEELNKLLEELKLLNEEIKELTR